MSSFTKFASTRATTSKQLLRHFHHHHTPPTFKYNYTSHFRLRTSPHPHASTTSHSSSNSNIPPIPTTPTMHPWHWHWHRPSRLLWFMLGAVTGAWAMKHKEGADNYRVRHCSRYQIPQEAYPPPQGSANANAPSTREDWHAQWHARWRERERQWGWGPHHHPAQEAPTPVAESTTTPATTAATPTTTTAVASPVTPGPTPGIPDLPTTADGWEEERQRLLNIKQQAANSVRPSQLTITSIYPSC